jgi:hypothetical protein
MNKLLFLTATLLLVPLESFPADTCVETPPPESIRHLCGVVVNPMGTRLPRATVHILQGDELS